MSQMILIYEQLRDIILSLGMAPGERFSERSLESRFDASRTPIRAALMRLETDGLVAREERGWMVTPISLAELEQAIEFRQVIEVEVVKLACLRAQASDIDLIEEILASCTLASHRSDWHRVGSDFHVELARLSGNRFYMRAVEDLMVRLSRARWLEVWDESGRERSWSEHRSILGHIRAGAVQAAIEAVGEHISGVRSRNLGNRLSDGSGHTVRGYSVVGKI
ncbi:GntR family transcriptional regulator [Xanthobacter sp. VNH20]|uniref:GntR family transcriptional regulator n=1 Tax=Xanthobacter sp. VNH20 TaxID=3156616 RepID=UPI0032B418D2